VPGVHGQNRPGRKPGRHVVTAPTGSEMSSQRVTVSTRRNAFSDRCATDHRCPREPRGTGKRAGQVGHATIPGHEEVHCSACLERWPSQPATRYRPSPSTSQMDAPGGACPIPHRVRDGRSRRAPCSTRNRPRTAGGDAFWDRCAQALTEATAIEGDHRRAFPQVDPGVVGLAGLEPAASSLSAIKGSALCRPAFSQVAGDRRGRSNAFLQSRVERAASPCARVESMVRVRASPLQQAGD
jgi:hypothetical protein